MRDIRFSRRYFFYGSLLAGAVPAGGFGSAPSLAAAGFKTVLDKLNVAGIGIGGRGADDIGTAVPIQLTIGTVQSPSGVTIAVQ